MQKRSFLEREEISLLVCFVRFFLFLVIYTGEGENWNSLISKWQMVKKKLSRVYARDSGEF